MATKDHFFLYSLPIFIPTAGMPLFGGGSKAGTSTTSNCAIIIFFPSSISLATFFPRLLLLQ